MADSRSYITHYVRYFNIKAPGSLAQATILLLIGALSGGVSGALIHQQELVGGILPITIEGVSTGILVISLPAFLTAVVIKTINRKMKLKHALLATLLVTTVYAILIVTNSLVFAVTQNIALSYLVLVLSNACLYGYWLIITKVLVGKGKGAIPVAAVQPVLNIMFYIPLGSYMLDLAAPLQITLIRLFGGMSVFLVAGYVFLYLLDRPAKKTLEVSGIKIVVSMVGQWLYDLTNDVSVIGKDAGIKRDLGVQVLALVGKKGYKGIFLNPDIHFGPFQGVGGSVAPLQLGSAFIKKYSAAPFILHSLVDIEDNPISTSQVSKIARHVEGLIGNKRNFRRAYGNLFSGQDGKCRALNITIGDANLLFLTKAPCVTEDMNRDVGLQLRQFANNISGRSSILIDAHNSRFESASAAELAGIQVGSKYVYNYENAIRKSLAKIPNKSISFGASYKKLAPLLKRPKDLGEGYTSVCVFKFGRKRFCMIYFDSNNMLPGFREKIIGNVRQKFGMEAEMCTTDTHSINTLAESASNSLGKYTNVNDVIPILDSMVQGALSDLEPVNYLYKSASMSNFAVWGDKADELIEKTSRDVRRTLVYIVPLVVVLAFIVAAWVIYVI